MARPKKQSFEYFPIDSDLLNNRKIRKLIRTAGLSAVTVYITVLGRIYRQGYYLTLDEDTLFDISEELKISEEQLQEYLEASMQCKLFHKEYFAQKIITSDGIQEQYTAMCKASKRAAEITEYNLLNIVSSEETMGDGGVSSEKTTVSSEETHVNSEKTTQNKIKEKESKDKVNEKEIPSPSIVSPSLDGGGRDIISLLSVESINREDILEACRLTNDGAPGYATDLIVAWQKYPPDTKRRYPFANILDYLRKLEAEGKITAPSEEEYTVRRWLRNNLTDGDSKKVLSLLTTPARFADCLKLIGEIKKGRINLPLQFLLKRLQ